MNVGTTNKWNIYIVTKQITILLRINEVVHSKLSSEVTNFFKEGRSMSDTSTIETY